MTPQIDTLADVQITGLTADSRRVEPGYLFAALPSATRGSGTDGREYIPDALARGAVAVLAPPGTVLDGSTQLVMDENPRRQLALLAARFYQRQPKTIAAVTGTNGKSSVVGFTQQIWSRIGLPAASIGTLGHRRRRLRCRPQPDDARSGGAAPNLGRSERGRGRSSGHGSVVPRSRPKTASTASISSPPRSPT